MVEIIELAKLFLVPVGRGIAGWFENAIEDGKISLPEWRLLGATTIRILTLTALGYYGLNGFGVEVDALSVAFGSALVDFIYTKIRSIAKKKK